MLAIAMASTSVAASLVEETSGGAVSYQFDADTHHDAPDMCKQVGPEWTIPADNRTDGILVPLDDESDHYILNLTEDDLGGRFTMTLRETSTPAGDMKARLDILAPLCAGSVLDPANQPPVPPEPGAGEKRTEAVNTADPTKCSSRWFFVLTGVDAATMPATISAIWTDGYQEDILADTSPPEPVGQYQTTSRLDTTLHGVTAIVPEGWDGNFRLGEAPCGTTDGQFVFGDPAVRMGDQISFSVLKTGPYVVAVHLGEMEPRDPMEPVPMSCHYCGEEVEPLYEKLAYWLFGEDEGESSA